MASDATKSSNKPPDWYKESRKKDSSPTGSIVFTVLRLLEIPWQTYFLTSGLGASLLTRLGASPVRLSPTTATTLGLSIHPYHALIMGLATGTSLSQIFWVLRIRENYFPPSGATAVALYNTLLNTANSLFALWNWTSQAPYGNETGVWSSWSIGVGTALYALGTYLERYSEVQRKDFKSHPENVGKPFSDGHFSVLRNINYTGYTLMRTGYAMVCGGWMWCAVLGGVVLADFAFRAVPWLEGHCEERYGQQWREVKKKVPYRLIPGVF